MLTPADRFGALVRLPLLVLRHPLEAAVCGLLLALTATVFAQVIARYVFEAPLSWSEELARFMLMWLSMLSAAYAMRTQSHFALSVVVRQLTPNAQKLSALFAHAVVAAFFAFVCGYAVVFLTGVGGHLAPALQIPMEIPYASVAAGSALMSFEALRLVVRTWREPASAFQPDEG